MGFIKTFSFAKNGLQDLEKYHFGADWPVVYVLENKPDVYVGETVRAAGRTREHLDNEKRQALQRIHVIADETYNKSATLDIESQLIQYMSADGSLKLQNANAGIQNHSYYQKDFYRAKFVEIWEELKMLRIVERSLDEIKNSDLFKYSPYKALTEEQQLFVEMLVNDIKKGQNNIFIVHGAPGSGKTVLATYLMKYLRDAEDTKNLRTALVVPMASLRKTLKKVFVHVANLRQSDVIGPNDVAGERYDILVVDEAHRLKRRKNLGAAFKAFDTANKLFGLGKEGTQLDWIIRQAGTVVLFYDAKQNVMPADIGPEKFKALQNARQYSLQSQLRVEGGTEYIRFIEELLGGSAPTKPNIGHYELRIFDDVREMHDAIRARDREIGLSRMVAGYAWPWRTNVDRNKLGATHDIEIGEYKATWNTVAHDWVNSTNALNEVGCIHTVQGYDLNYVGVILGPEIKYDPARRTIVIDRNKYFDRNGFAGVADPSVLREYILNIYRTLLSRGIKGTYIYACDPPLHAYIRSCITNSKERSIEPLTSSDEPQLSPISVEMVLIPLVGYAPCGGPIVAPENIEGEIEVQKSKLRPGAKYFVIQAVGDSMNLAGIQDGDLLLCRAAEKADTGDRVVAILEGEKVTVKVYGPRENGVRLLLPKSTNTIHRPITPAEGDSVQGIVQEVLPEMD